MQTTQQFINTLTAVDFSGQRRVPLAAVPIQATVGEVVSEMARALELPRDATYHAEYQGIKLNRSDTLQEAGLEDDAEVTLYPEVTAGRAD